MADSLQLIMEAPARIAAGEPCAILLRVTNISGRPLELYLAGREVTADVTVRDAGGATVWHKLAGAALPAIVQLVPLPAGDSLLLTERWTPRADAAGDYSIEAELLTDAEPLRFPPQRVTVTR